MHKKHAQIALIVGLTAFLLWLSTNTWARPSPLWQFPVSPTPAIARGFDPPVHNWLPGHRGVDLRAYSGQAVVAPANGTVSYVSNLAGRGVVVLSHGQLRSTYEPVTSPLAVGDVVFRGDEIGWLECGNNHCCIGSVAICLHWGLRRGLQYLNPLGRVDVHIRLLPISPLLPRLPIPAPTQIPPSTSTSTLRNDSSPARGAIQRRDTTESEDSTKHNYEKPSSQKPMLADAPARKPNVIDPSKRAYKVAWLPNWHGQGSLALL